MKPRATDRKYRQRSVTESNDNAVPPSPREYGSDAEASQQIFGLIDDTKLKKLRERLRSLQYTEERVSRRLGIWHISAITMPEYPVYQERLRQRGDALSIIISLFLLQSDVPREAADGALGSEVVDDLLVVGLLTQAGTGVVTAAVSIYPCSGSYFVTDHHFRPLPRDHQSPPHQPVMHLGQDSYALAYLATKPLKGGRVLDTCAGSGVHAILAARQAGDVIGIDINPRAVEFARLNAALNGVAAKCDFRCGSLYDAVGQEQASLEDERFDLILANPPFIPSPPTGSDRLLFQDGGLGGDEVLGPVLAGLLKHMTPRGSAAIISMFTDQKGSHHQTKIKRWIGPRTPVDLLLLKLYSVEPEELAFWMTWQPFGVDFADYSERYKEWLDALRSQQIVQLTYGVLVVRMSQASSFRTVNVPLSYALDRRRSSELRRLVSEFDQSTAA